MSQLNKAFSHCHVSKYGTAKEHVAIIRKEVLQRTLVSPRINYRPDRPSEIVAVLWREKSWLKQSEWGRWGDLTRVNLTGLSAQARLKGAWLQRPMVSNEQIVAESVTEEGLCHFYLHSDVNSRDEINWKLNNKTNVTRIEAKSTTVKGAE